MEKTSENPDIEDETHDLPIGVGIKDLRKVFKVRNVSVCAVIKPTGFCVKLVNFLVPLLGD